MHEMSVRDQRSAKVWMDIDGICSVCSLVATSLKLHVSFSTLPDWDIFRFLIHRWYTYVQGCLTRNGSTQARLPKMLPCLSAITLKRIVNKVAM